VKEYVKSGGFGYISLHEKKELFSIRFQNCTPEVDLEKGEIRFVKND